MDEPDISAFDLDYALTGAEQERYDAMTDEQAVRILSPRATESGRLSAWESVSAEMM